MNRYISQANKLREENDEQVKLSISFFKYLSMFLHISMLLITFIGSDSVWRSSLAFFVASLGNFCVLIFPNPKIEKLLEQFFVAIVITFVSIKIHPEYQNVIFFLFTLRSSQIFAKYFKKLSIHLKEWKPFHRKSIEQIVAKNKELIDEEGLECSSCKAKYSLLTMRSCCSVNICMTCNYQKYNGENEFSKCHQCSQPCNVRSEVYTVLNLAEETDEEERMISFD